MADSMFERSAFQEADEETGRETAKCRGAVNLAAVV